MSIHFPDSLVRKARRLLQLGYTDPASIVGADAAYYARVSRSEIARSYYEHARERLSQLSNANPLALSQALSDAEIEIDRLCCAAGWEALRPVLGDVKPWSRQRIAQYAIALERRCEDASAAAYEAAAYGGGR